MPWSKIQRFSDPSQYQASIHGAQVEILPTESGEFSAEITKVALLRLRMQRSNEILPRILRGAVTTQRVAIGFLTDSEQPDMLHCGYNVSPTEIIVVDRNSMHRRSRAPCRWGTISITPKELAAASSALLGRPVTRLPATRVIRPAAKHMSRLLRLHETAGNLARTAPDILANHEVARALENAMTHAMIMCLTENARAQMSADNPRRIMARFDEFLVGKRIRSAVCDGHLRCHWRVAARTPYLPPGTAWHESDPIPLASANASGASSVGPSNIRYLDRD